MWAIAHWPDSHTFADAIPSAPWVQGIVIHHTYRPLPSQWRGHVTMEGLRQFYARKGWQAGPHLFLVHGSPNPAHDGIWQLTSLATPRSHAGPCNATTWGIEVVGDFNAAPMPAATGELLIQVVTALARVRGLAITPHTVRGHRDCMPERTCPGSFVDLDELRQRVTAALAATDAVTATSSILALPRCPIHRVLQALRRHPSPHYTDADCALVIVPTYYAVATEVGVDPLIAIAQCMHETGWLSNWWSARPRRNPAGIGVTGVYRMTEPPDPTGWAYHAERRRWEAGVSFPSWQESIRAHVGRLLAYATQPSDRTAVQQALIRDALRYRPLPRAYHGAAPRLCDLDGRWAVPGVGYGQRIAAIANQIITA